MGKLKDLLIAIVSTVIIIGTMILFVLLFCKGDELMDADTWNNGICKECGGEYRFTNADKAYPTSSTKYYYSCDTCQDVVALSTPQRVKIEAVEPEEENTALCVVAEVVSANPETGITILVDEFGEEWVAETALTEGEQVVILFDTMGTDDIYDDEILEIFQKRG